MALIRPAAAVLAGLLAVACGPTEYEPATAYDETGYRTTPLEGNRYLVEFEGGPGTSRQMVETYLLYRAAEVAQNTGHPWFALVEEEVEQETEYNAYRLPPPPFYSEGLGLDPDFGPGPGFGGFPYYTTTTWPLYASPRWGAGAGVSTSDSWELRAIVEMLEERPEDRPDVLNTRQVIEALTPEIAELSD